MYRRKIDWYMTKEMLNQVYRQGLEYAFVSRNFKQICPFVLCKDFLQDALQGHIFGIRRKIYGFVYDPAIHKPIYTNNLRLIVGCSKDRHFGERMPNVLDLLHQVENKLGIKKITTIRECMNPPEKYAAGGIWLFEGHKRWLASPPMLSMYTLMLRIGLVHSIGDTPETSMLKLELGITRPYSGRDKSQIKAARKGIALIFKLGDKKIFSYDIKNNYSLSIPLRYLHNNMGIVGFSKKHTALYMPKWHQETK